MANALNKKDDGIWDSGRRCQAYHANDNKLESSFRVTDKAYRNRVNKVDFSGYAIDSYDKTNNRNQKKDKNTLPFSKDDELEFYARIIDRLQDIEIPEEALVRGVSHMSRSWAEQQCVAEWGTIPTKKTEYHRNGLLGKAWTAAMHYDKYWKSYCDDGYVYQNLITKYDPTLVSDLRGFTKRRIAKGEDVSEYIVPTYTEYKDKRAAEIDAMLEEEARRELHYQKQKEYNKNVRPFIHE